MDINVTSASKRTHKVHVVASAIYVVTQEGFRRSSAANIPSALRMAPVARARAVKYPLLEVSFKVLRQTLIKILCNFVWSIA
jgi:hypothetical protein